MPFYYAEHEANREDHELQTALFALDALVVEIEKRFPYVTADCKVVVDVEELERVKRRKYSYFTNRMYDE